MVLIYELKRICKILNDSMKNVRKCKMFVFGILVALLSSFFYQSCDEYSLHEKVTPIKSSTSLSHVVLTPALINEYRQAELAINRRYVNEVKSIISNDFEEKLEVFSENEFGFFKSYKHMLKVLIEDKDGLTDYWNLKKNKYFSNLTTHQKLHDCYENYRFDVQKLRGQICGSSRCLSVPKEVRYNIRNQDISLEKMTQHSYINLVIEFGVDIAVWLLIMGVVALVSLLVGCVIPPVWIITLISIVVSVVLSIYNDNRMIDLIREQYQTQIELDNMDFFNELDKSTNAFYDYISK